MVLQRWPRAVKMSGYRICLAGSGIINPTLTRTEGRAPVRCSEFTIKAATLQGASTDLALQAQLKFLWSGDCVRASPPPVRFPNICRKYEITAEVFCRRYRRRNNCWNMTKQSPAPSWSCRQRPKLAESTSPRELTFQCSHKADYIYSSLLCNRKSSLKTEFSKLRQNLWKVF
jgi:hypothetical protein